MKDRWKNKFGHDEESEILTVIKRMQEGKFKIKEFKNNTFYFSINLTYYQSVPISHDYHSNTDFLITNDNYIFTFKQINGETERIIKTSYGYVIWSLLSEKYIKNIK